MECRRLVHSAVIFAAKPKQALGGVFYSSSHLAGRHHVFTYGATSRRNTFCCQELRKVQAAAGRAEESPQSLQWTIHLGQIVQALEPIKIQEPLRGPIRWLGSFLCRSLVRQDVPADQL